MLYVADDNDNDNATVDADIVHHLLRLHPLDNDSTLSLLPIRLQGPTLFLRKRKLHYCMKSTLTYNSKPPLSHHLLAAVTPKKITLEIVYKLR